MTKPTKWPLRTDKTQINLGICSVWSVFTVRMKKHLYQSLNRLPIWDSKNCSMFPLAFVAGSLQGHWWGFISRNYVVWPISFLVNVFIGLKGTLFLFLFGSLATHWMHNEVWSDCVDAQAELSLCWAHMLLSWFCRALAHYLPSFAKWTFLVLRIGRVHLKF